MWYLILLLLSSLMCCANRYSDECLYSVWHGALVVSLWNQGGGCPEILGTTALEQSVKEFLNGQKRKFSSKFSCSSHGKLVTSLWKKS
jgi:hypothetical protein